MGGNLASYAKMKDEPNNWRHKFCYDPKLVTKLFFAPKLMPNQFATQSQCVALEQLCKWGVSLQMNVVWVFDHTYCVNCGIFISELCEREKDANQILCWNIFVNELYMWTKKEWGW